MAYTKFESASRQVAVAGDAACRSATLESTRRPKAADDERTSGSIEYEFLPSAEEILEEIVPAAFKVRLFKCFLDAAVSEQIFRRVAMKAATENADDMIGYAVAVVQPGPPDADHVGTERNHRRRRRTRINASERTESRHGTQVMSMTTHDEDTERTSVT